MPNDLMDILKRNNYRATTERAIIFDALSKVGSHFTAEALHQFLVKRGRKVSLATIYRTLSCLAQLQLLRKIDLGEGASRYELVERVEDGGRHYHLICMKCGKLIDFKSDLLSQIEELMEKLSQDYKFKIFDHELTLFGYCEECASRG